MGWCLVFPWTIVDNGWHSARAGGLCLEFVLLTLTCAYIRDTRVRACPLFRSLVREPRRRPTPVVRPVPRCLTWTRCSLSAPVDTRLPLFFQPSLLPSGLGCPIWDAGRTIARGRARGRCVRRAEHRAGGPGRPCSCTCPFALACGPWRGRGRALRVQGRALGRGLWLGPGAGAGSGPWHSPSSRCRMLGCSSTSITPVTTPRTCHLAPSSSPSGGGPRCCPSFSLGMKGEGGLDSSRLCRRPLGSPVRPAPAGRGVHASCASLSALGPQPVL